MIRKQTHLFLLIVITVTLLLGGCRPSAIAKEFTDSQILMGTVVSVKLYGSNGNKVAKQAYDRMRNIEELMSVNISDSEVSEINRMAGIRPVKVSNETYHVVEAALRTAELSGGKFDPTIGPLVDAWAIGTERARIPSPEEIDELKALVNWRDVELDPENQTVFLKRSGMKIDLGGVAKGFAADEIARLYRQRGVRSAFVSLGGNVYVIGDKPDGSPWRIGLRDPLVLEGQPYMAIVEASDVTFVTSGTYERYFIRDGKRYHHLLDPYTGYPAESDLESATIITDNSMLADTLSTAVFILGKEKGIELLNSLENVDGILIDDENNVWATQGVRSNITIVDKEFRFDENR